MKPSERALLRIREEMQERHISQRDLAGKLHCSQGRIAKILAGGVNLRFDDLATLADAVGIKLTEAIRDRGLEFHSEMTPTDLRLLEHFRRLAPDLQQGFMLMLTQMPHRTRTLGLDGKVPPKRGRPQDSDIRKREAGGK